MNNATTWQVLLSAPFRCFYLSASLYGIYILLQSAYYLSNIDHATSTNVNALSFALWHGHELVFGFVGAVVLGFILTALPSWAGCSEISPTRLLLLVGLWCLGRISFWALQLWPNDLPIPLVALLDSALFLLASSFVATDLWRAKNRWFTIVLLIFAGFWLTNLLFYYALSEQLYPLASLSIRLALYAIMFKFVIVGGLLTAVFSNNIFKARHQPLVKFSWPLESLAIFSILLILLADATSPYDKDVMFGCISLAAGIIHLVRLLNLRGWQLLEHPLLVTMNLAYAWMVLSLLLSAATAFGWLHGNLWLHSFTVGAMGLMMFSLMSRVALRHTGRPLEISGWRTGIFIIITLAAIIRLIAPLDLKQVLNSGQLLKIEWFQSTQLLIASALLFSLALGIYLILYGSMLYRPSLAKKKKQKTA